METDKAWDAIHRCLTDGTLRDATGQPLEIVILGGRRLYSGADYIMTLKNPNEVRAAAPLLAAITKSSLDYGGELGDEDFDYTWEYFLELRNFWQRAAG